MRRRDPRGRNVEGGTAIGRLTREAASGLQAERLAPTGHGNGACMGTKKIGAPTPTFLSASMG